MFPPRIHHADVPPREPREHREEALSWEIVRRFDVMAIHT
jgi:hypothetical protein